MHRHSPRISLATQSIQLIKGNHMNTPREILLKPGETLVLSDGTVIKCRACEPVAGYGASGVVGVRGVYDPISGDFEVPAHTSPYRQDSFQADAQVKSERPNLESGCAGQ